MDIKRLHVSGLTPEISKKDLEARFSSFGTVKAVDGVGALDGLGFPRKYAYISLETNPQKFSRCLNVLSGTTWKGAKLRIGEAKPDFKARNELERITMPSIETTRPLKQQRLSRGVHGLEAKDMSLVSLKNAASRRGWKITSLSHLIHPVRMRPSHPISRARTSSVHSLKMRKRNPRAKPPPTRARRQKIDPERYGAVHLTEKMLEADVVVAPWNPPVNGTIPTDTVNSKQHQASGGSTDRLENHSSSPAEILPAANDESLEFEADKRKDRDILADLFKGKDEWDGKEDSITEDNDSEVGEKGPPTKAASPTSMTSTGPSEGSDVEMEPKQEQQSTSSSQFRKLKDIFSYRADPEPVSILAGLNLELDDDLVLDAVINAAPQEVVHQAPSAATASIPTTRAEVNTLDFSVRVPYFFPLEPHESSRGATKDIYAISRSQGWTNVLLSRMSSDDIKKEWEDNKVNLTKDWKQRHREALKRKRRGGVRETVE